MHENIKWILMNKWMNEVLGYFTECMNEKKMEIGMEEGYTE